MSSHEQGPLSYFIYQEPDIHIENTALDAWKNGQLVNAEALLTAAILYKDAAHVLASRALVRARLQQWDIALVDADEVHFLYSHIYRR